MMEALNPQLGIQLLKRKLFRRVLSLKMLNLGRMLRRMLRGGYFDNLIFAHFFYRQFFEFQLGLFSLALSDFFIFYLF